MKAHSDYAEHIIAHNTNGDVRPHGRYQTGFMGYSSWKADGSPRPSGGMFTGPQSTDRNDQSVVGWHVYDGEDTDEMIRVAHFWGTNDFTPENDNATDLGWAGGVWKDLYLGNAPIVRSDRDLKKDITTLSVREKNVAQQLKALVRRYRLKNSVEKKGDEARYHVGVIAQDVIRAFDQEGLNASDYALVCGGKERGEHYSIRYEELLAFITSAL